MSNEEFRTARKFLLIAILYFALMIINLEFWYPTLTFIQGPKIHAHSGFGVLFDPKELSVVMYNGRNTVTSQQFDQSGR